MTRGAYYRSDRVHTKLYCLREAANLSQPQAALVLGVSERTYRTRESDEAFEPGPEIVAGFAEISPSDYHVARLRRAAADVGIAGFAAIATKPAKVRR